MHRATDDAGAADAAAEAVAPLMKLVHAAHDAESRGRRARCAELRERALAAAEASLPRDSLITARLLQVSITRKRAASHAGHAAHNVTLHLGSAGDTMQQLDDEVLVLTRKGLFLCDARFRAGTLFTPTPEERAFFDGEPGDVPAPPLLAGPGAYFSFAVVHLEAVVQMPRLMSRMTSAVHLAFLRAVHGALQAAQHVHAHGWLKCCPATGRPWAETSSAMYVTGMQMVVDFLLRLALDNNADGIWQRLRAVCHISDAEETALRQLAERSRVDQQAGANMSVIQREVRERESERQQRADADMARHGLRACALPECDAVEPQPKAFKICSRCRAVCYCSAAHQQADWRRHKRADGCKAST
jgi:hypothetical protein